MLDFNKAEKIAVERTLREMSVTPDERMLKRYSELNLAQWHLLEQGKITRSQVKSAALCESVPGVSYRR